MIEIGLIINLYPFFAALMKCNIRFVHEVLGVQQLNYSRCLMHPLHFHPQLMLVVPLVWNAGLYLRQYR